MARTIDEIRRDLSVAGDRRDLESVKRLERELRAAERRPRVKTFEEVWNGDPEKVVTARCAAILRSYAEVAKRAGERVEAHGDQGQYPQATGYAQSALDILCDRLNREAFELDAGRVERTPIEKLAIDLAQGLNRFKGKGMVRPEEVYVDDEKTMLPLRRTVGDVVAEILKLSGNG